MRRIKLTFESNDLLKLLFPDVLYSDPKGQSPKWALDIDTPVLTVEGWKKHGELCVGDQIFGKSGQVITVIGNSGPMLNLDCSLVQFDDCELVASNDHLWPIEDKRHTSYSWSQKQDRNIITTNLPIKDKTQRLLSTPAIESKEWKEQLILDPYILGLWLGDGTTKTNIITINNEDEDETLTQIENANFDWYIHRKNDFDNFSMFGLVNLKPALLLIDCWDNKHIPARYLYGTKAERLALLQGLMDSDGTCSSRENNRGRCTFVNANKELANGVYHLAASLGFRPSLHTIEPKQANRQVIYHVYFVGTKSVPPFRLTRKLSCCKDKRVKVGRYVRSIVAIPKRPVNCIKVDAVDGIYLAGTNLVPTHNSEDDGIIIRRKGVYNEATLEAWGLVDGMPTSRHYTIRVYDDVVTKDSVSTAEQIKKTDEAFKLSQFLGARGGSVRVIGTRYHFADQYSKMKASGAWELRERKGVEVVDGAEVSVFLTQAELHDFKKVVCDGNTYIYNCQMLLDPVAEEAQEFKKGWLRYYRTLPDRAMNLYMFVDPASEKKKKGTGSDYTVMWVWGLDPMGNHFLVDLIRERLNLFEKWKSLSKLMRKHPTIKKVYYERYGMQADIQHYQHMMKEDGVYFSIEELGGSLKKEDRIRKLVPMFENYKVYLPEALYSEVDGRDLVKEFVDEEYLLFPFASHDDGLDAASRIKDEKAECYSPISFPSRGRE